MNERLIEEIEILRQELLEMTPKVIQCLKDELRENEEELARLKIRGKYLYLIPDSILKFFYSEFKEKDE